MVGAVALPTGTLTFLFTDIEGSTRLLHELGDAYDEALTVHRRILRDAFTKHDGQELNTEGDAFFVAFERASDAIAASIAFQLALQDHDWPHEPIRVRAGLHTGEARIVDNDLVGMAIHEAARIAAAAHGGQVLVSGATAEITGTDDLVDVGRYRLKDIAGETQLFEISHPELRAHGRARLDVVRPNNLPRPATSLVAREAELDELDALVRASAVVTISGPGGAGKTRVAVELGHQLLATHPGGVWFVDLAPVVEEGLIWDGLSRAMSLDVEDDVQAAVLGALARGPAVVIFDNCEHVVEQAADVCSHLQVMCSKLSIIATSREPLDIDGEVVWRLPVLGEAAATELFVARANLVNPGFALDDSNAAAVASICRRLDGLPLAIELAAARTRMLTAGEIDERLADRFKLLTGGSRSGAARQQTLRATIDWSYDHLSDSEQLLLRRVAVFAGSFSFAALEGVCNFDDALKADALDLAAALIDRSMLTVEHFSGSTRYRLLESMREYAFAELGASGEAAELATRHLKWFTQWAEGVGQHVDNVPLELENVRGALTWSAHSEDQTTGLRLAVALSTYWERRGFAEGREWISAFLDAEPEPTELRVRALLCLGHLAERLGATPEAAEIFEAAFAIDNVTAIYRAQTAHALGGTIQGIDFGRSVELLSLAVELFREANSPSGLAQAMHDLAICEFNMGEAAQAYERLEQALLVAQDAAEDSVVANVLGTLAQVDNAVGDPMAARERAAQVLDVAERLNDTELLLRAHTIAAQIDAFNGHLRSASDHHRRIAALYDSPSVSIDMRNRARLELASMLIAIGDYAEALAVLKDELDSLPTDAVPAIARTLSDIGLAHLYEGDFAGALRACTAAAARATDAGLDQQLEYVLTDIAAIHCANGALAEAREALDRVLRANPDALSSTQVVVLVAEGRVDDACRSLAAWLDANPPGSPLALASPLECLTHVVSRASSDETGALLLGALLEAYRVLEMGEGAPARQRREETTRLLVGRLGQESFDAGISRGCELPIAEAFALGQARLVS